VVGGGSGDTAIVTTSGAFKAQIPLQDSPTTFQCSTLDANNTYTIGTYATEADCNTSAQAWLDDYNIDDTPSTQAQADGLAWLNVIRAGVGLPLFKHRSELERATGNHENYIADVIGTFNVNPGHYEYETQYPSIYFTGAQGTDRAIYEGYQGYYAGDVIAFQQTGLAPTTNILPSLDELMSAIYHRQALLWNFTNEIGIGGTQAILAYQNQPHLMGAKRNREGFLKAIGNTLVAYPYNGETNVRKIFNSEYPDPLPNVADGTGNPISVSFNNAKVTTVSMVSFKLFIDATNTEVTNTILMDKLTDPNGRFTDMDFALFPLGVLTGSTTYRVEFNYIQDGILKNKVWRFTTRA
jgi:hypothetical protein